MALNKKAFTLIEMLVVIAIIGILAALLLAALANAKVQAQTRACNNNLRQLAMGCQMYAHDNNAQLVSSWPLGWDDFVVNPYSWCPGWASTEPQDPLYGPAPQFSATNIYALQQRAIWAYVQSAKPYLCPTDNRNVDGVQVVRSYSMNSWVSGRSKDDPSGSSTTYPTPEDDAALTDMFFRKESDFRQPSMTWVLIDEDGDTINDSLFLVDMASANSVADQPTTRHGSVYDLEFADGHVENIAWQMPNTDWFAPSASEPDPDWVKLKGMTTFPR